MVQCEINTLVTLRHSKIVHAPLVKPHNKFKALKHLSSGFVLSESKREGKVVPWGKSGISHVNLLTLVSH